MLDDNSSPHLLCSLDDEEVRAAKESSKQATIALRDPRAAYNAWRAQAKHAQNLAEWQMRCEAVFQLASHLWPY